MTDDLKPLPINTKENEFSQLLALRLFFVGVEAVVAHGRKQGISDRTLINSIEEEIKTVRNDRAFT